MIDTAIVVCPQADLPEAGVLEVRVAGIPLLARALLTAQRAGIQRFAVVASGSQQATLRALLEHVEGLRGRVRWLEPTEGLAPPPAYTLLLPPSVVLDAVALRAWLLRVTDGGSVTVPEGEELGPLAVPAPLLSESIEAARGGQPALRGFLDGLQGNQRLVRVPWEGARQHAVRSAGEVPAIERAMLAALHSPEDGPIVDRFVNRGLSALITRALVDSRVTPNQVTVASLVVGLLGAWLLGTQGTLASLWGLVLFQLSVVLDHVDGELARLKFLHSPLGKWLDNLSDHAVGLAVIASLTWRVAVGGMAGHFAVLGLAAAIGVTGAFLMVFWWSLSGRRRQARTTAPAWFLARILAVLANRDGFCLALWAMLLLGRPTWFLWALALGANAYWMAWLWIYGLPPQARMAAERVAG